MIYHGTLWCIGKIETALQAVFIQLTNDPMDCVLSVATTGVMTTGFRRWQWIAGDGFGARTLRGYRKWPIS